MIKHRLVQPGFSLIELIVVIGLTSILAITITSIAMTSLIGTARVRNLMRSRQSGDSSLNQIQTKIRNAREITACDSSGNTLTILNQDGESTTYALELSGETMRIASNSGIYITPEDTSVTAFDIECLPSDTTTSLVKLRFNITNAKEGARSQDTPSIPYETSIQIRN